MLACQILHAVTASAGDPEPFTDSVVIFNTVRSVAGDREAGVTGYLLSLPVPLAAWFRGRMARGAS